MRCFALIARLQPVSVHTMTLSFVINPLLSDSSRWCMCVCACVCMCLCVLAFLCAVVLISLEQLVFWTVSCPDWSPVLGLDREVGDGQKEMEGNGKENSILAASLTN